MLRDLNIKPVYKSEYDNILEDFYIPALKAASRYDRAVGFFSASTLSYAAQGLSTFIRSGGKIRLILGAFSDADDIDAALKGYKLREISEKVGSEFLSIISDVSDSLFQNRLDALSWLIAHGRLDIKIALREKGMYHEKVGIISDDAGDQLVFSGSANESLHALLPTFNYESISVYPTWRPELEGYYKPHISSFEKLWANEERHTAVIDIPSAAKERLLSVAQNLKDIPDTATEVDLYNKARLFKNKAEDFDRNASALPKEPATVNGQPFAVRPHQIEALERWRANGDFHGILALATGAGKTITAIHSVVKLSEKVPNLTVVIAVPYQNLADQWCDILAQFNIWPIRCYETKANWLEDLRQAVHEIKLGLRKFTAIVVVNRTLKTPDFQKCIQEIKQEKLYWIGDECHHHGSGTFLGNLPQARFRLGLSATPDHYADDDRNTRLQDYYGDVVYEYTLEKAIQENILTPYHYHVSPVEFLDDEAQEFLDLSDRIGFLFAKKNNGKFSSDEEFQLQALLRKRSRLLGSAKNKLKALDQLLDGAEPQKHTLFYCGDGSVETDYIDDPANGDEETVYSQRQIEIVSQLLQRKGWDISRFTARESRREREQILESFRLGMIDAMVAIKCLDEGIDVPACSTAYILASSKDPRQFIQRRGRILRRSPGKKTARIFDFIMILPERFENESEQARKLIKSELGRVAEFANLSQNRYETYAVLRGLLGRYDLEHLL